ncbi:MAG: hypothetical protein KDC59_16405 [Saprospiraceae bacterium]|nr:hypothetical protein [Bacteroidota bacterium]MCB0673525.1 hypothetical protein [Saprospiraceae bacterium]
MELVVFKNILYGELKPWQLANEATKFYRQNLTIEFQNPKESIQEYYTAFKELHSDKPGLFKADGLEVYLLQADTEIELNINAPLVEATLEAPLTTTQKFYHYLLKNETTRLTDRIFQCFNKDISDIDKKGIVQSAVKSIKDLLLKVGTDQTSLPDDDLTNYVIAQLISNLVRLLKETELLYPDYLQSVPSTKQEVFGELLNMPVLESIIDITTPLYHTAKAVLAGVDTYQLPKDSRFSFGFTGDADNLKTVIYSLNRQIELLKDETTADQFQAVLTSKNLQIGASQIHLNCETTQFSYIVGKLEHSFTNFNPTSIEQSNLFYSKKGNLLKRNNLYKNKNSYPKQQTEIDNILKQL